MGLRLSLVIVSLLVVAAGVFGSTTHPRRTRTLSPSPAFLVNQQATKNIQKQQSVNGKVAEGIKVIQTASEGVANFALATFNVNGHQLYASLIMDSRGYVMSTFTLSTSKQSPIRYSTLRGDGFEYITGGVFNQQAVSNVVITWSDGTTVTVAVQHGYFGYQHKVSSPADPHVEQVIGVTNSGDIIQSVTTRN